MKTMLKRKNQMLFVAASSLLSMGMGANDVYAADGLIEEIKHYGFTAGAWANAGITYNATDPQDNYNGPVTFGDRSGEPQLNQLNAYIQRAVATEGSAWDFGARFDVMFGTDAAFTQAYGAYSGNNPGWDLDLLRDRSGRPDSNRFYGLAVPQAYAEIYAPIGNGLNIKVGHFYTPIGYETVPAPDNFFYSHAYTMQFGEPFTHTGLMANYAVNSNWSFMGGVVSGSETGGWDGNFDAQLGNWAGLMGATYTADNGTSINVSGTYGATSEINNADWSMYSIVLKHNITEKTHLVLQHDHGFADGNAAFGTTDAEWYGVNSHLTYDIKDDLTVGLRAEWFRDQNGFRVYAPGRPFLGGAMPAASYYEITAGLTWKPKTWLSLRPNVRYDWVDDTTGTPFDGGNQDSQFLFSTDVTVKF
ncbi:MAG: porin [Methylovulum sp.]|nr:porin [Methylovulum sp.]